jgi:hypothetical protein
MFYCFRRHKITINIVIQHSEFYSWQWHVAQQHIQDTLFHFHYNNGCANPPKIYVTSNLPTLLWFSLALILLMWRIGRAPNSIPIYSYIQQDATLYSLFISGNCSTCFGRYFHPSSGAYTTVSTASCICPTVTAICRYRGRVGTGLSVLWVAYATLSTIPPTPGIRARNESLHRLRNPGPHSATWWPFRNLILLYLFTLIERLTESRVLLSATIHRKSTRQGAQIDL